MATKNERVEETDEGRNRSDSVNLKLHKATKPQTIFKLLSSKSSLNHCHQDREGNSALHACVSRHDPHKHDCLMTLLIHTQCKVNLVNFNRLSALHIAVNGGELFTMKALIAFGADLNQQDLSGQTPFDIVHSRRLTELGEILARVGAKRGAEVERQREEELERQREEEREREMETEGTDHSLMLDPELLRESLTALAKGGGRDEDSQQQQHQQQHGRPTHLIPVKDGTDDSDTTSKKSRERREHTLRFATPEASIENALTLNRASLAARSLHSTEADRQLHLSDLSDSFSPLIESPEVSLHLSNREVPDHDLAEEPDHHLLLPESTDPTNQQTQHQPPSPPPEYHTAPDQIYIHAPSQDLDQEIQQQNGESEQPECVNSLGKNWTVVDVDKDGQFWLTPQTSVDVTDGQQQLTVEEVISRNATPEHREKRQSTVEYNDESESNSPPDYEDLMQGEGEGNGGGGGPMPYMRYTPKPPDSSIHRLFDFSNVDRVFQSVFKKLERNTDDVLKEKATLHTSDEAFAADYAKREVVADQQFLFLHHTTGANGATAQEDCHGQNREPTPGKACDTTEEKVDLSEISQDSSGEKVAELIDASKHTNGESADPMQSDSHEMVDGFIIPLSELKCPWEETNSIESRVIENPFNRGLEPQAQGKEANHIRSKTRKTLPKADPIRKGGQPPEMQVYGATALTASPDPRQRCEDDESPSRGVLTRQRHVKSTSPQSNPGPPEAKSPPTSSPRSKSPAGSPKPKSPLLNSQFVETQRKPPPHLSTSSKKRQAISPYPPPTLAESPRPSTRQSSLRRELSIVNPGMTVTTSILGHSVAPLWKKPVPMKSIRKPVKGFETQANIGIKQTSGTMGTMGKLVSDHSEVPNPSRGKQLYQDSYYLAFEPEYREERVLCLDGGGVKGLIQIEILQQIENFTGRKITDLFDWIVGTSTGGIITLAMVYAGMDLPRLRQLYFEMKETVFRRKSKVMSQVCDTKALEELLHKTFGEKMLTSVTKPKVLITAVHKKMSNLPVRLFNNCLNDDYTDFPVWKVARYTSAAPVYFKECDDYVDGGVKANNPCSYGLTRIQRYNRKKKEGTKISCLVSVGCGIFPPEPIGNTDIAAAIKFTKLHKAPGRMMELLKLLTNALPSSEEAAWFCQNQCEEQGIPFYRFNPDIGEEVDIAETDNNKLFNLIIEAKHLLHSSADHVKAMVEHLK